MPRRGGHFQKGPRPSARQVRHRGNQPIRLHAPHWRPWHAVVVHIDHDAADFPYEQLAAQLRDAIDSGRYPAGSKLPTIIEIAAETGLSPMTIRRAFRVLAGEGLVRIVPGRGTFTIR